MNCILRGVRVIDPLARRDAAGQDVWLSEGRIIAIYKHMGEGTLPEPPPSVTTAAMASRRACSARRSGAPCPSAVP